MPQSSRTFRIFVSSTFSDLKAERNALQEKVFPPLRDLAAAHGCRFQAIDLRWGVSEEAALDQQTMKICLGEIERCQKTSPRPNFIVLLGDRYGWQPLPYEIPADEFALIINNLTERGERLLVESWYRRDDNAIPPTCCLQPRTDEFINPSKWAATEAMLHHILEREITKLHLSHASALKYVASATEQEIETGALRVPDAEEHVFCFLRDIRDMPEDGRTASFREADEGAAQRQGKLKERLKEQLSGNVHEYTAQWQGDGPSLKHLDQLCEDVYAELSKVILAEAGKLEKVDSLDAEIAAHETFGTERAHFFVGRKDILGAIEKYISGKDFHPLAIWGASGSGKSALMAKAVENAQKKGQDVLYRFIGATPESSNGRALLESLCMQISRRYGADEFTIPAEYTDLVQEFLKRLALATTKKPLIIFLDALDQLSDIDHARSLIWLPADLPPNVHLVISTLPGDCLLALESKLPAKKWLKVQHMSVKEGKDILIEWLSGSNRQLQKKQEEHLLGWFQQCGLPLFLKLAFEEARLWKSYDALPPLGGDIPGILKDLFKRISMESNHGEMLVSRSLGYLAAAKNGLSEDELLDVLSMDAEVLKDFQHRSPKSPKVEQLPVVIWSRLYFDLEPYLAERKADGIELLGFYHRQMREAVNAEYPSGEYKPKRHQILAIYFGNKPLQIEQGITKTPNLRKLSELPFHQTHAKLWNELKTTLTDFDFMKTKCSSFSVYDLEIDYQLCLDHWTGEQKDNDIMKTFVERLRLESHAINKAPELLFPHLYNHLTWLDAPDGPIHALCERAARKQHGWLRMTQDPRPAPTPWLRSFEGHNDSVTSVSFTPDGQNILSGSGDKTIKLWDNNTGRLIHSLKGHTDYVFSIAISPDGRTILSGSADKTLKLWDKDTGQLIRSLEGHTDNVNSVAFSPDGQTILSGSDDNTIKLWDKKTGKLIRSLEGHTDTVNSVAFSPDGKTILSGSNDKTIKLWDKNTDRLIRSIKGHTDHVKSVAFSPDGLSILSGSRDKTILLCDKNSGRFIRSLKGHASSVLAVTFSSDGQTILSGSSDNTIKLWEKHTGRLIRSFEGHKTTAVAVAFYSVAFSPDGQTILSGSSQNAIELRDKNTGRLIRSLEGHIDQVNSVSFSLDGQTILSGSHDYTIKLWDRNTGLLIQSLKEHTDHVNSVAFSPDGQTILSGSDDNTIKLWDKNTGRLIRSLEGHTDNVNSVAFSPDGQAILSGSQDYTIKLWDGSTGKLIRSFKGHTSSVVSVTFSPDGQAILSGSMDKTIRLWERNSGRLIRLFKVGSSWYIPVAFSPDGQTILSGSADDTIKLWDKNTGKLIHSLKGHSSTIEAIAISPDGQTVLSGSMDNTIKLWDKNTGQLICSFLGHTGKVNSVAFSPDGQTILSGSDDNTIKLWDKHANQAIRSLEGHSDRVSFMTFSPDGQTIISGSQDYTVKIWDRNTGRLIGQLEGDQQDFIEMNSLVLSPDGQTILLGQCYGTIESWDKNTGHHIRSFEGPSGKIVTAIAFSPDKRFILSKSVDKTAKLWNINTGRILHSLEGHNDRVCVVAFSPDGQIMLSGSGNTIRLWDRDTGKLIRSLEGQWQWVTFSPDGQTILSRSADKTIKLWDRNTGRLIRSLEGHTDTIHAAAFFLDGQNILSGSSDKTIKLWDTTNGTSRTLFNDTSEIISLVTHDHYLACGDTVGHVWIFEWIF